MKIVFVRHGKDDDNYRGGWSELDLIPEGVEQARKLAKHLKNNQQNFPISRIVSSDLTRTMTTAKFISEELGLPVLKEPRLRETNNGDLAGMHNEIALKKYPGLFFGSLKMDEAYPNGESPIDFYERIKSWFKDFMEENTGFNGNILVVTHGGVIKVIYHLIRNIVWSNQGSPFKAANCSIHVLNTDAMEFEVENNTEFLTQ